jgi:hypothetical protein
MVEFKWRRNHLFDMELAVVLFEQCAMNPGAVVEKVETKPTMKWYVPSKAWWIAAEPYECQFWLGERVVAKLTSIGNHYHSLQLICNRAVPDYWA